MSGDESVRHARSRGDKQARLPGTRTRRVIVAALALVVLLAAIVAVSWPKPSSSGLASSLSSSTKADRVDVVYFHRTERCQSCLWTGEAVDWTVKTYFADELARGKVTHQEVDVQKPENAAIAQRFRATGSSLFLNFVKDGQDNIVQASDVYPYVGNTERFAEKLRSRIAGGLEARQ